MNRSRTRSESLSTIRIHWQQIVFSLFILVAVLAVGQARAATTIVGSGLWNTILSFPSCSYTQVGTLNISYASGAYSATYNASTGLEDFCATSGPWSCNQTGFFAAQDLLSESQFRDAIDVLMLSCAPPATALSLSIVSADIVSGTGDYAGLAFSFQLTRATSTSYPLVVSKSGSGTVTSSSGGIDCGATCSANFTSGTSVTLTATPSPGYYFYGWNEDCSGHDVCTVSLDQTRKVTARFRPVPFAVATTGVDDDGLITASLATVTTTITFNTPDVGKSGSVFVTGWAPYGGLNTLGVSTLANATASVTSTLDDPGAILPTDLRLSVGPLAETDTNAFILIQLTSSGWQLVVNGQLIPYASGVLGDQLAAQSILNNTATANLLGAQFCLGYGTSAAEMMATGRMQPVAAVPGANAAEAAGSCLLTRPQTGWWWNPLESGRGFSLEVSGNNLALATFLYDASGRSTWYLSAGPLNPDGSYSGPLSEFTGGQTLTGSYRAASVKGDVSTIGLNCETSTDCTLSWAGGTVALERFVWDASASPASAPETGWWWNANESGRGYFIEMQGTTLGATAYMYDAAGNALWYLLSAAASGGTVQSQWSQFANGQTLTGSYVAPIVANDNVGPVTIQFSSPTSATLTLPDGRQIPVERFRF